MKEPPLDMLKTPQGQERSTQIQLILCLIYIYMHDYDAPIMGNFLENLMTLFGTSNHSPTQYVFLQFLLVKLLL